MILGGHYFSNDRLTVFKITKNYPQCQILMPLFSEKVRILCFIIHFLSKNALV